MNLLLNPYLVTGIVSFLVNIPLGYWRENSQKFSWKWLFWVHASIPLIVYMRGELNTSKLFIPVCIFLAVWGQIIGSRYRRKEMSQADIENHERIFDLRERGADLSEINDDEVMVVLMNMGGPKTNDDVSDVQRRLFNDSRLIRFPFSFVFQPVFAWLLITFRTKATKERYQLIGGGSPIYKSTENQTAALRQELLLRGRNLETIFSFNYSHPLPDQTISEIKASGKKYILPVSLYPHYSSATTGSNVHYLREEAKRLYPELKFLKAPSYHMHDEYIRGFIDRINEAIDPSESLDDFYLVFSAHGLPLYFLEEGDPYFFEIAQTVGNIINTLKRNFNWTISYQSAVGPMQWVKPSTDSVIEALAERKKNKVIVIPISFVTDHIETTCEIDIEYREMAETLGISDFRMTKALECHPGFISALADTVELSIPKREPRNLFSSISPQEGSVLKA